MEKIRAANGALTLMVRAGAIADFEVIEAGNEIFVRVWSPEPRNDGRVRKEVAAIIPVELDENHVLVMG
jgi:hypothetical protein